MSAARRGTASDDPDLDDPAERVTAHLDLAAGDRGTEVARHETLGAVPQYDGRGWTTLQDPAGTVYCVTDRAPGTR